jgi:hypothetical protein
MNSHSGGITRYELHLLPPDFVGRRSEPIRARAKSDTVSNRKPTLPHLCQPSLPSSNISNMPTMFSTHSTEQQIFDAQVTAVEKWWQVSFPFPLFHMPCARSTKFSFCSSCRVTEADIPRALLGSLPSSSFVPSVGTPLRANSTALHSQGSLQDARNGRPFVS